MGISGLLPLLKSIQKPCTLKKFSGQTIGVDAYGWLHRGTATCAVELAQGRPTSKYVEFAMNRVRMLIHFGVTPYMVFDGDYLPSKAGTEKERAQKRRGARERGLELLKLGKTAQAYNELQKAVDVTPEMARHLIEELKKAKVDYVVAPYEADSQLVYLEREGIIHGILSEDSDLLVFGAKCLLTKLDQYGECVMIRRQDFTACREVSLVGWTDADFRRMAILSGCDYLDSMDKMGLKTAYRHIRRHKTIDRVVRSIQFDGKFKVPPGYLEAFNNAELTFLHQWVFCPKSKQLINLTPIPENSSLEDMPFIGRFVPADIATAVARGDLHPHSKEPIILNPLESRSFGPRFHSVRNSPTLENTTDKKSKPIDSFFKPKRIPLAELDPNSFQPTQSQQRILDERQEPWIARPTPPRSSTVTRTLSSSSSSRRSLSETLHRSNSTPHPAKRQRLCSDSVSDAASDSLVKVETGKSRFFTSTPAKDESPSLNAPRNRKKAQKEEFTLWSDDSIEDALAKLDDSGKAKEDTAALSSTPEPVTKDGRTAITADEAEESELSIISNVTTETQLTAGTLTPATSCGTPSTSFEGESIFSEHLNGAISGLSEKFACTSTPARSWAKELKVEAAAFHAHRRAKTSPSLTSAAVRQTLQKTKDASKLAVFSDFSSPALERKGSLPSMKRAFQPYVPASSRSTDSSKLSAAQPASTRKPLGPSRRLVRKPDPSPPANSYGRDQSAWEDGHESLATAIPPSASQTSHYTEPKTALQGAISAGHGSEDLLVPTSEDEISELDDEPARVGGGNGFGMLDLGKFAFPG